MRHGAVLLPSYGHFPWHHGGNNLPNVPQVLKLASGILYPTHWMKSLDEVVPRQGHDKVAASTRSEMPHRTLTSDTIELPPMSNPLKALIVSQLTVVPTGSNLTLKRLNKPRAAASQLKPPCWRTRAMQLKSTMSCLPYLELRTKMPGFRHGVNSCIPIL